jgi:hypothetical protein
MMKTNPYVLSTQSYCWTFGKSSNVAFPITHDEHLTCVPKVIFFNDSKPLCLEYFDSMHEPAFVATIQIPVAFQMVLHTFVLICR